MFYDFAITVPADTSESIPLTQDLKLTAGIIHRVEVEFRFGPNHEVGLKLFQGGHQVWPTNPDGDFRSDGHAIAFDEHYQIDAEDNIIKAVAFSPGTSYDHKIFIRFGILTAEELAPLTGIGGALKSFLALVGVKE